MRESAEERCEEETAEQRHAVIISEAVCIVCLYVYIMSNLLLF